MVHRYLPGSNLRAFGLPLLAALLLAASVAVAVAYNVALGLLALAVSGFISYHLVRFFVLTLKSHLRTSDEGLVCITTLGSESRYAWEEISHAGWYSSDDGDRDFFVYAEDADRLLSIPAQYEALEAFAGEIAERTGAELMELTGESETGLADALREQLSE